MLYFFGSEYTNKNNFVYFALLVILQRKVHISKVTFTYLVGLITLQPLWEKMTPLNRQIQTQTQIHKFPIFIQRRVVHKCENTNI